MSKTWLRTEGRIDIRPLTFIRQAHCGFVTVLHKSPFDLSQTKPMYGDGRYVTQNKHFIIGKRPTENATSSEWYIVAAAHIHGWHPTVYNEFQQSGLATESFKRLHDAIAALEHFADSIEQ